jgi:uncharacterized OB-fold protein
MIEELPPHLRPDARGSAAAYWDGARRGKLLLPHCPACSTSSWPPRKCCPACGSPLAWVEACGRGIVHTHTVVRQNADPWFAERVPYVVAMIELEEGPRIMSHVVGCDVDTVRVGMPVGVIFVDVGTDIRLPMFEPFSERR